MEMGFGKAYEEEYYEQQLKRKSKFVQYCFLHKYRLQCLDMNADDFVKTVYKSKIKVDTILGRVKNEMSQQRGQVFERVG